MSYSSKLPEEEPTCECRWDEAHQRMDRDDCHFHFDLPEEPPEVDQIETNVAESEPDPAQTIPLSQVQRRKTTDENRPTRKPPRRIESEAEAG